ncbi:hypothetical protein EVAR_94162_1 [Eumeta japonica]|uniref:Uncharacterized protein n=1 Tax=Eumeta variegata TaxID=151549 RepID=A0A4C1U6W8_EUMVA|nr:hypothetical protein EVAR_94162_1 [Eumeta japonica]
MKHLYELWAGVKPRRLEIQETLGFGLRRLRLGLCKGVGVPFVQRKFAKRALSGVQHVFIALYTHVHAWTWFAVTKITLVDSGDDEAGSSASRPALNFD